MDRLLLSSVIFLCTLALAQPSDASSMGGLVKDDRASVMPGESAVFDALIWTRDENRTVRLSVAEAPLGWTVVVQPEETIIGRNFGDERVSLPGGQSMASKVKIVVKTGKISSGENRVVVSASSPAGVGQLSFSQSVMLRMLVDLPGEGPVIKKSDAEREVTVTGNLTPDDGDEGDAILYVALAIVILAVSAILYRYA